MTKYVKLFMVIAAVAALCLSCSSKKKVVTGTQYKCKECGKPISSKANKCPNCGARIRKTPGGWFGIIVVVALLFSWIVGSPDRSTSTRTKETTRKKTQAVTVHKMGETVSIGYTSYLVWRVWWSNTLSDNKFLDEKPNASFLFIELTVRNNDSKARTIPPFKLIDENQAEYETSSKAWAVKGGIDVLESLNPGVSKQGLIVFDVPRTHAYALKVSGGYWSATYAFIVIVPK